MSSTMSLPDLTPEERQEARREVTKPLLLWGSTFVVATGLGLFLGGTWSGAGIRLGAVLIFAGVLALVRAFALLFTLLTGIPINLFGDSATRQEFWAKPVVFLSFVGVIGVGLYLQISSAFATKKGAAICQATASRPSEAYPEVTITVMTGPFETVEVPAFGARTVGDDFGKATVQVPVARFAIGRHTVKVLAGSGAEQRECEVSFERLK
jgi:hypothetical protein